jgi:ribosomal-protein-alanine N-acetyltransferase
MRPPERLTTSRLALRVPRADDAEAIHEYAQDPEVVRFLQWRAHTLRSETLGFLRMIEENWRGGARFEWAITERGADTCIGMIGLRLKGFKAELGYVLRRDRWNQGLITEAAGAVCRWAQEQAEIYRVQALCDIDNAASARVMQKLGMHFEGIQRRAVLHPNVSPEPRDALSYAWSR